MTLKELYTDAIEYGEETLCLLLEFLVIEKQAQSWDDDKSVLDRYFKPNNKKRMNELLLEYREETK